MPQARHSPLPRPWTWIARTWIAPRRGRLLFALGLLLALGACGPRVIQEPVASSDNEFKVLLRRTLQSGKPVPRNYQHPATISDVRLAHILANLTFEDSEGKRRPVIRSTRVYPLAEALNKAAQQASPDDEIAVVVYANDRRLGLFNAKSITAFRMFFDKEFLNFEFYDIERELEAGEGKPGRNDDYRIPLATPEAAARFKILPGEAHFAVNRRTLQVEWRNPYFAQPVALSVRGNRFKRRSVLMEAEPEAPDPEQIEAEVQSEPVSAETRDAQISALDQLDGLRRQGLIKEAEFQRRRRLILQGKLDEAGYEPAER